MLVPQLPLAAAALQNARLTIAVDDAAFRVEGPGAMSCLQGLLTNDVTKLADGVMAWGAFLTAKGMIVSDAWVMRDKDAAWVIVPGTARATMQQLFAKTMPPRLAKVTDRSDTVSVRWVCGGAPGSFGDGIIARPEGLAPFTAVLLTSDDDATDAILKEQGWMAASQLHADALKVLMGWPTLGREIDDRTLPQEVRFDELGGVRYDKGCYTGQETVARLHFRGHANRALRGVRWAPGNGPTDMNVMVGEKAAGTLRTIARLGDELVGLAVIRREVIPGTAVRTGECEAVIVELPFQAITVSVA